MARRRLHRHPGDRLPGPGRRRRRTISAEWRRPRSASTSRTPATPLKMTVEPVPDDLLLLASRRLRRDPDAVVNDEDLYRSPTSGEHGRHASSSRLQPAAWEVPFDKATSPHQRGRPGFRLRRGPSSRPYEANRQHPQGPGRARQARFSMARRTPRCLDIPPEASTASTDPLHCHPHRRYPDAAGERCSEQAARPAGSRSWPSAWETPTPATSGCLASTEEGLILRPPWSQGTFGHIAKTISDNALAELP